jgi:hypothetical protein
MTRLSETETGIDLGPLIKAFGPSEVIRTVIEAVGLREVLRQFDIKQIIAEFGPKRILAEFSMDELLASLTPEQRAELKQRLQ